MFSMLILYTLNICNQNYQRLTKYETKPLEKMVEITHECALQNTDRITCRSEVLHCVVMAKLALYSWTQAKVIWKMPKTETNPSGFLGKSDTQQYTIFRTVSHFVTRTRAKLNTKHNTKYTFE